MNATLATVPMMLVVALLLLTTFAGGSSQRLPERLRSAPGAVIEDLGLVYPVTSHVEARFSLSPLRKALELLAHHRDRFTSLQGNLTLDPSRDSESVRLFNQTLSLTISSLGSFAAPDGALGGSAQGLLGFLGGVGLSELQEYRESISVVKIFDASVEGDDGGALSQEVEELTSLFKVIKDEIVHLSGTANETHDITLFTFQLFSYQIALNRITGIVDDLTHALSRAIYGKVMPNLISHDDLNPVLGKMSYYSLIPLFPLKQYTPFYASLKCFVTASELSIMIPLHPSVVFKAFRIHPFPHKTNNSHFVVQTDHTLIFKLQHRRSISYPPADFLNSCSKPAQNIHVCYSRPLAILHREDCSLALATGGLIPVSCYFDVIDPEVTPFVLSLPEVTLLYFYRPTFAIVACEDRRPHMVLEGTFLLPHRCELDFLSLHIPAAMTFAADVHSNPAKMSPSLMTLPAANVTIPESRVMRVVRAQNAGEEFLSEYDFSYPIYVNLVGMFILILLFGACYLKAYRMARDEETKQAVVQEQSAPCLPQSEAPPAYSES
nr:uncharacterized protein LOC113829817 [Penaeus vannamei]